MKQHSMLLMQSHTSTADMINEVWWTSSPDGTTRPWRTCHQTMTARSTSTSLHCISSTHWQFRNGASNFTFNNCQMAVFMIWDFIWAFRDLKINNCPIGISVTRDRDPQFGGVVISDTVFQNVTTGIITTYNCSSKLTAPASMTLNHVDFRGAQIAVAHVNGTIFLQWFLDSLCGR